MDTFYVEFEQKFRGSRELIKSRLEVYVPFVKSIVNFMPPSEALDLGCGRGEWLEILREINVEASGVDLDSAMVQECDKRGER